MKVLLACERSGKVKNAFLQRGIECWSCDLEPAYNDAGVNHLQCDVLSILHLDWTCLICHPPCTYLCAAASGWIDAERTEKRIEAVQFAGKLWTAHETYPQIRFTALENPKGILKHWFGKATQIIQPWQFGHGETKETHLWLRNLPVLRPTNIVAGREQRIWKMAPGPNRSRDRSETYQGIADAMAQQWGDFMLNNL